MNFKFRGLMAPVFTPFHEDCTQTVNLDVIPAYAKYLLKLGVKGVLVNGTSGEGMSLTTEERKAVTEAWVHAVKDTQQTLMVQVGGACLKDVQDMAKHCEEQGVSSLLCLPDLFNKPANIEDLVSYLKTVGSAAPKTPLLYYHLPAYTGVHLEMSKLLVSAAAQIPTFVGAKYTHTDLQEAARCIKVSEGNLAVFLGCDEVMAGAFVLGFDSVIATTLNMIPAPSQKILELIGNGNNKEALKQQYILNKAIAIITRNGGWVPTMKVAMNLMTPINVGSPRLPLRRLTEEQTQQLNSELKITELL